MTKPVDLPVKTLRITVRETLPIRQDVLRPGKPVEAARFAGDDAPETAHFGASEAGRLVSIASLFRAECPGHTGEKAFQLRGMATVPEARGKGYGEAVLRACLAFAREQNARWLWCNARTGAAGFYRKFGFKVIGEEFEIPDVGPHFRMILALDNP